MRDGAAGKPALLGGDHLVVNHPTSFSKGLQCLATVVRANQTHK